MKKILENKPRLFFLIELVIVVLMVSGAFVAGYFYKDTTTEEEATTEESAIKVYTYTTEEIEAALLKKTISGAVVSATERSITVKANNINIVLAITKDTTIEKGVSLTSATYKELTEGKAVSVSYNSKTDEAINIWFEK
jgi:flagellar basal body-associated protein FliL